MGTAEMVWSITSESSWMGVGPDPAGSVSATYTGRSTVYHVDLPASPADCGSAVTSNHCTRSTTWMGEPTTKSEGRSSPQRNTTGSPSGPAPPGGRAFGCRLREGCALIIPEPLRQRLRQRPACRVAGLRGRAAGSATGCRGAWRVAAMTRITPIAVTASATAAIIRARGGPPTSASESAWGSPVTEPAHLPSCAYTGAVRSHGQDPNLPQVG